MQTILEDLYGGEQADDRTLARVLAALGHVEPVMVNQRCAQLWSRSLKAHSQQQALDTVVSTCDLTTLEGVDTPERVRQLAAKAAQPDADDPTCPRVAAVCVYPDLAGVARAALDEFGAREVNVAAVATGFPAGRTAASVKLEEIELAIDGGANEIDIVIDRGAFLSGRYSLVLDEIRAAREACGDRAHLKVILETGELGSYEAMYQAAMLALIARPHFIKTSTGKIGEGATPQSAFILCQAVRDFQRHSGYVAGVKAAGGIRSAKDACRYVVMVAETLGVDALSSERWRFGASGLLNDVLAQRRHLATGVYPGPQYFSVT